MTDISNDTAIATGTSVARTLADRAADIGNVLDEGADPTGSINSNSSVAGIAALGKQPFIPEWAVLNLSAMAPLNFVRPIPAIPYALAPGQEDGYNGQFVNYGITNVSAKTIVPLGGTTPTSIGQAVYNTSLYASNNTACLGFYTGIEVAAGAGSTWGENTNIQIDSNAGNIGIIGYELDINITNQDYPISSEHPCYGFYVNGVRTNGYEGTAAFCIGGIVGYQGWHVGFYAGGHTASDQTFLDHSSSTTSIAIQGSHTYGIDTSGAILANGIALRLGVNQSIVFDGDSNSRYVHYNGTNFIYGYGGSDVVQISDNGSMTIGKPYPVVISGEGFVSGNTFSSGAVVNYYDGIAIQGSSNAGTNENSLFAVGTKDAVKYFQINNGGSVYSTNSLGIGGSSGPTWSSGSGAPTVHAPVGSIYSRIDGGIGSTLYISRGSGIWNAVPGV